MPLQLLPLEETDFSTIHDIKSHAFADGLGRLFFPNGEAPADRTNSIAKLRAKWLDNPDKYLFRKVVDPDVIDPATNRPIIAGFSDWELYDRTRTDAEREADEAASATEPKPASMDAEVCGAFMAPMMSLRHSIVGNAPYLYLHILATLPAYQRKGVGALSMAWGCAKADELGVPLYIESSPEGRGLYERWGCEKVADYPFDARRWGLGRDLWHVVLVREAKGKGKGEGVKEMEGAWKVRYCDARSM